jgi:hypothetical protein
MAQPLVTHVWMVPEADRVHVGVEPAGRGHDHVPGWHVVRFDQPGVAVAAEDLEAVEVGGRDRADDARLGEPFRLVAGSGSPFLKIRTVSVRVRLEAPRKPR